MDDVQPPTSVRVRRLSKASTDARRALRFRLGAVLGQRNARHFALVGHARTGSNYLRAGIGTSRAVRMYDELFAEHRRGGRSFEEIVAILDARQPRSISLVGFKVFYNHLRDDEWRRLLSRPLAGVIHLRRRNRLRTLISLEIAFKTDRWTGTRNTLSVADRRVVIDAATVVRRLDEIGELEAQASRRLQGLSVLDVVYEEVVGDPAGQFGNIGDFLGLDDIDARRILLPRQNPERISALVVNFTDVRAALAGTPYSELLGD